MKLLDAQRYLAAAYIAGTQGVFRFKDLPEGLMGRTLFQQAVQQLGYVKKIGAKWAWDESVGFPTLEMQEETLAAYKQRQEELTPKKDKPVQSDAIAESEASLVTMADVYMLLQVILANQQAIATEFGVTTHPLPESSDA